MKKQIIWLIVALVVLFLIYFLMKGLKPQLEREEKSKFAQFDTLNLTKFEIINPGTDSVTLEKIDNNWFITKPIKYDAEKNSVDRLLSAMNELNFEGIISENPEKRNKFSVDSTGTQVKVYKSDKVVLDFIVGKTDQNRTHTYIREVNANKVYSVDGNLKYHFNKTPVEWRDKTIINLSKDDINTFEVIYNGNSIFFTRLDTTWLINENGESIEVDPAKISSLLYGFSPMRATKFQDEPITLAWQNPDESVRVEMFNGDEYLIKFIKKDDREVYVKTDQKEQIYLVNSYNMKRFQKKLEDFKE